MRTIILDNEIKADDLEAIARLAADILNEDNAENTDFQAEGENVREYDFDAEDSILWMIESVAQNEDGTASRVQLDC